jgi:DNA-directed RNA polymerase specialized sigma24 family protein
MNQHTVTEHNATTIPPLTQVQQPMASFTDLYDRYAPSFYGEIQRQIYKTDLCNAVLMEAFQEIWEHRSTWDASKESQFIWCFRIVRKAIRKHKVALLFKEIFTCHPYAAA